MKDILNVIEDKVCYDLEKLIFSEDIGALAKEIAKRRHSRTIERCNETIAIFTEELQNNERLRSDVRKDIEEQIREAKNTLELLEQAADIMSFEIALVECDLETIREDLYESPVAERLFSFYAGVFVDDVVKKIIQKWICLSSIALNLLLQKLLPQRAVIDWLTNLYTIYVQPCKRRLYG